MRRAPAALALAAALGATAAAADLPRPEVMGPGSQPPEIVSGLGLAQPQLVPFLHSDLGATCVECCAFCHGNAQPAEQPTEILHQWRGSMMAHASRDPVLWAALAVAEQDFAGIGDTCIRCHVPKGWIEGRSLPSDGSALLATDANGVSCALCHHLANPDGSEALAPGVQALPFLTRGHACRTGDAHEGVGCNPGDGTPCGGGIAACSAEVHRGNAALLIHQDAATPGGVSRLGPYADALATHPSLASPYQRDAGLCGTCHDVSNPVAGDLAPAHGRLVGPLPAGAFGGTPGSAVAGKAALRNPPYAYGVEQRTYSEWLASGLAAARLADFATLPAELRAPGGAIQRAHAAAAPAGAYADGTLRTYTCQSCHLAPVTARGCYLQVLQPPTRADLPLHDLTGANSWVPDAIAWLDARGRLRLGGGLDAAQLVALEAGAERAIESLRAAADLVAVGPSTVRVVNLTGHKLFTGYPEGRRMWLRVAWYGPGDVLLREDGRYGALPVAEDLDGDGTSPDAVQTLLDPQGPHTRLYQVESGISPAWAARLVQELGVPATTPIRYDRSTGAVEATLADAASAAGPAERSFHLALNDVVLRDERIPPWRLSMAEARKRNASPVPATAYLPPGAAGPEAVHLHYDDVTLSPPAGALRGEVSLLYQTASWEYVQFLWKANRGESAFLADVGDDLLAAWLATGMSAPVVMDTLLVPEPAPAAFARAAAAALGLVLAFRRCIRSRPTSPRRSAAPRCG